MRGEGIRTTTGDTTGVAGGIAAAPPLDVEAESAGGDAALPIDQASAGLVVHSLTVAAEDIVFVKGVVEASDGLAVVLAPPRRQRSGGGPRTSAPSRTHTLLLAAPRGRESDLAELLADLGAELASPVARARATGDASQRETSSSNEGLDRSGSSRVV